MVYIYWFQGLCSRLNYCYNDLSDLSDFETQNKYNQVHADWKKNACDETVVDILIHPIVYISMASI